MARESYKAELAQPIRNDRRGIVWLTSPDDRDVDALEQFNALGDSDQRTLLSRFDAWVDGQINKRWYHGFQGSYGGDFDRCFVFKIEIKRNGHRFYGFLSHPDLQNVRFEACVLVHHADKNQWQTERRDLQVTEEARVSATVTVAVQGLFPKPKEGVAAQEAGRKRK